MECRIGVESEVFDKVANRPRNVKTMNRYKCVLIGSAVLLSLFLPAAHGQDCFIMSTAGSTTLSQGGRIHLAFNDTCGTYGDNSGSFQVTLTLMRGGMMVQGPSDFVVRGIDSPCLTDFGGGIGSVSRNVITPWGAQAGDTLNWTASGSILRNGPDPNAKTGPNGASGTMNTAFELCTDPGPQFGLVGAVGGWPTNHHPSCSPPVCGPPSASIPVLPEWMQFVVVGLLVSAGLGILWWRRG